MVDNKKRLASLKKIGEVINLIFSDEELNDEYEYHVAEYQRKIDEALETETKDVVNAINYLLELIRNKALPDGGVSGQILSIDKDGSFYWIDNKTILNKLAKKCVIRIVGAAESNSVDFDGTEDVVLQVSKLIGDKVEGAVNKAKRDARGNIIDETYLNGEDYKNIIKAIGDTKEELNKKIESLPEPGKIQIIGSFNVSADYLVLTANMKKTMTFNFEEVEGCDGYIITPVCSNVFCIDLEDILTSDKTEFTVSVMSPVTTGNGKIRFRVSPYKEV